MPEASAVQTAEREVFSPSQLVRLARDLLENTFPLIWVEGEISNFSRPASGHAYFSLKDAQAQVRCAMFKPRSTYLRFKPADGMRVLARARVSLYEARGEFQLIVEHLEEAGEGALLRAFAELKARIAAEGLFDAAAKRAIPKLPRHIGIVTSPTGAAVHDVLSVLARRFPLANVEVLPVPVQGKDAPAAIAAMLGAASKARRHDVLLLTRGGGSLEDLWAFNDESVARAIRACRIPVVAAIGHEIDFTIADFAADLRAPTPTGAAELVTPDLSDWQRILQAQTDRMYQAKLRLLQELRRRLQWCGERLRQLHPGRVLRDRSQRLDELELRLERCARSRLRHDRVRLEALNSALREHSPLRRLHRASDRLIALDQRLHSASRARMTRAANRLALSLRALDAVSPLATLNRGYAIVSDAADGRTLNHIASIQSGRNVSIRLADGVFTAEVKSVTPGGKR
ncbi:MAG TPA: exodeoxyribonuclease VII large subunit [Rudaea sp.]|nr:exodeoxyribonuclease VII large subunit [Rudaea sp.]